MSAIESRGEPQSEEALKRVRALEERTRDLATFVAEHPEVALTPPTVPSTSASGSNAVPAPADSALVVLQQQRGRLEWRIAEAEKREAAARSTRTTTRPTAPVCSACSRR